MTTTERLFDEAFFRRLVRLSLLARKTIIGRAKGERRSRRDGAGAEFRDFRPYVAGDDLRYVDWNIYSRMDRLVLKLFIEEEDLCLHLLIDTSGSMGVGSPPKLEYALQTAAALTIIGLMNLERVAIGLFSLGLTHTIRPRRGKGQVFSLLRMLGEVKPGGPTDIGAALTRYALESRTTGTAVLITDLFDPIGYQDGVKSLLHRGFEVHLLHLLSEEELRPNLAGDLRLMDCEDGDFKDVTVDRPSIEAYQRNLLAFCRDAEGFCHRHGVNYLRTSTACPIEELIFRRLRESRFLQ
jgi:uncharacterized protein (DUF58 family)